MKKVTLHDFLMLFAGNTTEQVEFSRINTNNKSFPVEYRRNHESAVSFWCDLYKSDPYKLLNRYIKNIALLPFNVDIDKDHFEFHFGLDYKYGFVKIIKSEGEILEGQHLCPVIHIVLEEESKNEQE